MNDLIECEFVVEGEKDERVFPSLTATGWETVVFRLEEDEPSRPEST